jgi:hypothetical protein
VYWYRRLADRVIERGLWHRRDRRHLTIGASVATPGYGCEGERTDTGLALASSTDRRESESLHVRFWPIERLVCLTRSY